MVGSDWLALIEIASRRAGGSHHSGPHKCHTHQRPIIIVMFVFELFFPGKTVPYRPNLLRGAIVFNHSRR